jgi:hypothetical protein
MKKLFKVMAVFTLVLAGCDGLFNKDDGNTSDNGVNNITKTTSLKITNQSSYALLDVQYSSVKFNDMDIGASKTMNVGANVLEPIYFDLNINNNRIKCKTDEVIICDEGKTEDKTVTNNTVIRLIESNQTGTISNIYNSLSKPIFELGHNSKVIGNNDPIPVDFGNIEVTTNKSLLFTIKNVGNLPLELNGTPVILSSNAVFTIPTQPTNTSLSPGSQVAFLVLYTPTAEKEDNGTITIMNNSDALVFTLNIKGSGFTKKSQIAVYQDNSPISIYAQCNFGSILINKTSEITFTIENTGKLDLIITPVNGKQINIENTAGNYFSVIQQSSNTVIPGGKTTFVIRFSPTTVGSISTATVEIKTNSQYDGDFSFTVNGTGRSYIIGDEGPGGGIVFFVAGNQFMECSGELGKLNYNDAETLVNNYNARGYTDWKLPSRGNFELMAQNLYIKNLGGFFISPETYWTTDERLGYKVYVSINSIGSVSDGNSWLSDYRRVRAVRSFSL